MYACVHDSKSSLCDIKLRRLHHARRRRACCTGRRADKSCAERLLAELVRLVLGARAGVGSARRGIRGERRRER